MQWDEDIMTYSLKRQMTGRSTGWSHGPGGGGGGCIPCIKPSCPTSLSA